MIELPQGYYLTNFDEMLERVVDIYADLLSPAEQNFYQCFSGLPQPSRYLYVRMLMRKGSLFRAGKLSYAEIPCNQAASRGLQDSGLLHIDPEMCVSDWLPLFNKAECLQWMSSTGIEEEELKVLRAGRRAQLDAYVAARFDGSESSAPPAPESCYRLRQAETFEVFKLLYFGNPKQDLTDFILRDLHITRFEQYSLARSIRLFNSRSHIEQHLQFYRLADELADTLQGDTGQLLDFYKRLPQAADDDPRLQRKLQQVVLQLARQLERLGSQEQALRLYGDCQMAPARERRARILAASGATAEALDLCAQIATLPANDDELEFARSFAHRSAKKAGVSAPQWPPPQPYQPPQSNLALQSPAEQKYSVERLVAEHYGQLGDCYYVENGLFLTLFALIFWDVIYAPVAGSFTHPFQYRPHDLYQPEFLAARQRWYQQAIQIFDVGGSGYIRPEPLLQRYAEKQGLASNLAFWGSTSPQLLRTTLQRVPAADLERICQRLWQDLKNNRNGLPDLIFFPASGGYRLIEVKAPGDRLQKNQRRWMACFERWQISHEVVQLDWC